MDAHPGRCAVSSVNVSARVSENQGVFKKQTEKWCSFLNATRYLASADFSPATSEGPRVAVWPSRAPSALPLPPLGPALCLICRRGRVARPPERPAVCTLVLHRGGDSGGDPAVTQAVTLRAPRACESGAGARCAVQRALCSWGRRSPWPWLLPRVPRRGPMA